MKRVRWVALGQGVVATALLSILAVASAQPGAVQVFGPAGLVVSVDGAFVGQTTSAPGGFLITDVRRGRRDVSAFDAGVLVWEAAIEVRSGEVAVATIPTWPIQFGTSGFGIDAWALAVDRDGNILVAGSTSGPLVGATEGAADAFVRKFDTYGNEVWTRQFSSGVVDVIAAVAVDSEGHILVAGNTSGALGGENAGRGDAFVRKLDAQGNEVWTHQYGTSGLDSANAVAVDHNNNVLVAGQVSSTHGDNTETIDGFVRKLDARGRAVWTHLFESIEDLIVEDVKVDDRGNVLVAGFVHGSLGGDNVGKGDAFVRKLDADGRVMWTHQFGTTGWDGARSMVVGEGGSVIVVGSASGLLGDYHAGGADVFVRTLDAQGNEQGTQQFGSPATDVGSSVTMDDNGNVLIAGTTEGSLSAENTGGADVFVRMHDALGRTLWTQQFGTSARDFVSGVALDGRGNVLIAGRTFGTFGNPKDGMTDAFLHRLPLQPPTR